MALGVALLIFTLVLAALLASGSASAAEGTEPPAFDGGQSFPAIHDASYPQDYSWKVSLGANQELVQVDDETAEVRYESGVRAFAITAEPAHDAEGANVPTTIAVTAPDVLTLTVQHRAGNPAKGGAAFVYPISAGPGWEGGYSSPVIVVGPPDESELRAQREREEAARLPAPASPEPPAPECAVPKLKGLSLAGSRRRLRAADCRVGTVVRATAVSARGGRVVEQSPRPGRSLGAGTAVALRLG